MLTEHVQSIVENPDGDVCHGRPLDRRGHCLPDEKLPLRGIRLRKGLELLCMEACFSRDVVRQFRRDHSFLEFGCLLSGHVRGSTELCSGGGHQFGGGSGQTWFSYCQRARGTIEYLAGQPVCVIAFVVSSPLLETFIPVPGAVPGNVERMDGDVVLNGSGVLTPEVGRIVRQVMERNRQPGELDRLYLISKAYELLFYLMAGKGRQQARPAVPPPACLDRAVQILRENFESPPNLDDIARQSGLCASSLNSAFRKHYGTTVFGFLRRERLRRAKHLMLHERKSASEAAWEVGYSSLSSFHRAFLAQYGVTPGHYSRRE